MKTIPSKLQKSDNNELAENNIAASPFTLFDTWLRQAIANNIVDASAMVLATVDEKGWPDTRVVLLKAIDENGLVFFTHYDSPKALQAEKVGVVALNFYWRELSKQVRIRGRIERVSRDESQAYFSSRPRRSQISSLASKQSTVIASREELIKKIEQFAEQHQEKDILCPSNWGGYRVIPFEFEFFLGRDYRLNDRVRYRLLNQHWQIERLSP